MINIRGLGMMLAERRTGEEPELETIIGTIEPLQPIP
jgi:hypothetical protein